MPSSHDLRDDSEVHLVRNRSSEIKQIYSIHCFTLCNLKFGINVNMCNSQMTLILLFIYDNNNNVFIHQMRHWQMR
jgi:hypothetical protein